MDDFFSGALSGFAGCVFFLLLLDWVGMINPSVEQQDPCQQIHGLKTIQSRDYKPKYERGLKQVVSTCGDKNAPNK